MWTIIGIVVALAIMIPVIHDLMSRTKYKHAQAVEAATFAGDAGRLRQLLDDGGVFTSHDGEGNTPLHFAAMADDPDTEAGCARCAALLIERGADIHRANDWGGTPLSIARRRGHGMVLRVLEEAAGRA